MRAVARREPCPRQTRQLAHGESGCALGSRCSRELRQLQRLKLKSLVHQSSERESRSLYNEDKRQQDEDALAGEENGVLSELHQASERPG